MSKCIKCKKELSHKGFCPECYMKVYGFTKDDIVQFPMRKIVVKESHLELAKHDGYTGSGVENPIIIDSQNNLCIGHHRYNHARQNNWNTIPAVIIPYRGSNRFTEGHSSWLYVARRSGKVIVNVCRLRDLIAMFIRMGRSHSHNEDTCPEYMNIEIEIFYIGDKYE